MAGKDSDGHDDIGYIPEDPRFLPQFDFDDGNDIENFDFLNILRRDQHYGGNLVGDVNPNENYFDELDLRYLPESPNFFKDMHSDQETELNNNEFRQLLQPDEHDAGTLVESANSNENHFDAHDVAYVPEETNFSQQIHSDQGNATNDFEFSHPEEHDADTLIEDANPSENHSHGHDVGDFPENTDYPSQEHIPLENHVHGHELDVGDFAENTDYPSQENIIEEHHVEGNVTGNFASSQQQGSENDSKENKTERWPGWPGQNVFRLLVPVKKVGCIIGPRGDFIKKIVEETKARVKILSGPPGITERAVLISAREVPHCTIPPAVDGLLRVHKQIVNDGNDTAHVTSGAACSVITRLLVADSQGQSLVGNQGFTIKSIQQASGCTIRVLRSGSLPVFALKDDSVVEIRGESPGVHKAVELVALYLRKYLVDRSIIEVFQAQMQRPDIRVNKNMPPPHTWGCPPQGLPAPPAVAAGGHAFALNHQYMPPSHHYGNCNPLAALPPMDNHLHQGPAPAYAMDSSMGIHSSSVQPQQSAGTKDTQHMQIPISYANAVIGASGANISYIRGASGASITVWETKGVQGEMTVEISGSSSEIQAAQVLVQKFVAEAASATWDHMEGSNSQGHSFYAPPPPYSVGDHTGHVPSANDGPLDSTNFGH